MAEKNPPNPADSVPTSTPQAPPVPGGLATAVPQAGPPPADLPPDPLPGHFDAAAGEAHEPADPADVLWAGGSHHARRKRERKAMPGENIGHLNLTPMMDIMTMLLVFLVMSFATEPANINVTLDMRPPESTTKTVMDAATKITISKKDILVEDQVVAQVPALDPKQVSIPSVREALVARADHLKAIESRGGQPFDGRLLVIADATTPYRLVTAVLVTAGEAKFSEYKLVLMQKAEGE
jgi:biopolymer transport protein ExbD